MSLLGALNIGKTALAVSQASLQVTGQNISNAGNVDYSREVAGVSSNPDQNLGNGIYVGTGVDLTSVQRQADAALSARLNSSASDNESANVQSTWAGQVEGVFDALGTDSLDTTLGNFYNAWSNLANSPGDTSLRQVVEQNGATVATQFNNLNADLTTLQSNLGSQLSGLTVSANNLAGQIASLNQQIASSGGSTNNNLLDQRDAAISNLSKLINVQTVQQANGTVNVYVGSEPLVTGTVNRGLKTVQTETGSAVTFNVAFVADNGNVPATSGQIGGLLASQTQVTGVVQQINALATGVINSVNSVHASGQGTTGFTTVTGTSQVLDATVPLNSAVTGLSDLPRNGSFVVHVKDMTTGLSSSTLVQVNLTGSAGDTTLNSLATSLGAIPNVSASVSGGQLTINAANNTQITFSQDSSNTLASLGINTFFQGNNASNIAVNAGVVANPAHIAAAKDGDPGDNQTALSLAMAGGIGDASMGGATVNSFYRNMIGNIATATNTAKTEASATLDIRNTLESQKDSLSGVSIDEEAINLIQQQRAFQGAARLISTVDQMMQTLLQMT